MAEILYKTVQEIPTDVIRAAEMVLTLTKAWKNFRKHTEWMNKRCSQFLEADVDLDTSQEWNDLVARFDREVALPVEVQWQLILELYGLEPRSGFTAEDKQFQRVYTDTKKKQREPAEQFEIDWHKGMPI